MATKLAHKRLTKELMAMKKDPPPFILAQPEEKNILDWHFIIRGPPDSPYDGGEYHGLLMFPSEYPFKPPDIKMFTPSGRFDPGVKICMSMTSYHRSEWNAAWSVATILTGMLSFMLTDEVTTGGIKTSAATKEKLAKESHRFNIENRKFREIFPEYSGPEMKDLPVMGGAASTKSDSTADAAGGQAVTSPPESAHEAPAMADPPEPSVPQPTTGQQEMNGAGLLTTLATTGQDGVTVNLPRRSWFSRWRWVLAALAVIVVGRISKF
jgi:ubiquitin-conjugating enzyme E2 J2